MKKKARSVPTLCRHKGLNRGYVRLTRGGKQIYLKGSYTDDGIDAELKASYNRFKAEFLARENTPDGSNTIAEVLKAYTLHLKQKAARVEGSEEKVKKAAESTRGTIRHLLEVLDPHLDKHPATLGVKEFESMREHWTLTRSLTTTTLKRYFGSVRGFVRFGVSKGLMPTDCKVSIDCLADIKTDNYPTLKEPTVRDAAIVDDVRATMPHLNEMLKVMVQVLMATGLRPSELCEMKWTEIDTSETLWKYIPAHHKTEKKGKSRVIYFRDDVQTILSRWQSTRPLPNNDFLFTARESWIMGRSRNFPNTPLKTWLEASGNYAETGVGTRVLRQAVERACVLAGVEKWTPYQARHFYAYHMLATISLLYAQGNKCDNAMLEGVASLLGHSDTRTTRRYTGANNALAEALITKGSSVVEALIS